jgi:hypothetical protein
LFVFVGLIVIFQILVLWVVHPRFINLVVTEWSDEQHFLETIRLFASGLTLDNLKHYEDMSGPLPFLVYALWGKIAGMGLLSLRGLSILLFVATLLLFHMKRIYGNANVLMGSFALSWFYWLMPVRATQYALDIGLHTVGIFDRLLELTVGISVWRDIVFQALFFLGLPVLYYFARSVIQSALKKKVSFPCFMDISILSFFMVMPLSYLAWEKYFLLALPLVLLRVLMIDQTDTPAHIHQPEPYRR